MDALSLPDALRRHWPEYLIEAWALGMFMLSAGFIAVLLESPASPLHAAIADTDLRRALAGLAMGLTAVGLIYSRWGRQSGAHMNPAVTLSYLLLGRIRGWDALCYAIAQFAGGLAGVLVVAALAGDAFRGAGVRYVVTQPGPAGVGAAFVAEAAISALLMLTVLAVSSRERFARYTGLVAGLLVACFITFEAPLSGMSMIPARSFASAAPAGLWSNLWIYFTAPLLGMLGAAMVYRLLAQGRVPCAKLVHTGSVRCIHCGHEPAAAPQPMTPEIASVSHVHSEYRP